MKRKFQPCVVFIMACISVAAADEPVYDPIHALLFPPEVLIQHRKQLGLTDEQMQRIRGRLEELGPKVQEWQSRLNRAVGRLAELLSADTVDEEIALKQLDEVLTREKGLKRMHLRIMIQIRNELKPEQRKIAAMLKRTPQSNEDVEQRLKAKISRIENRVRSLADSGQPPFDAIGLMQKFPELMENGQVNEAEALLDRVLTTLGLERAPGARDRNRPGRTQARIAEKIQRVQHGAQELQRAGKEISEIHELMKQIARLMQQGKVDEAEKLIDRALKLVGQNTERSDEPSKKRPDEQAARRSGSRPTSGPRALTTSARLSHDAIRTVVAALKKDDVAWRKIEWKTCLLDGLNESRKQSKPVMLWIFIDRPVDDERC